MIRPKSITTISTFWNMEEALDSVITLVNNKKPVTADSSTSITLT